MNRRLLRSPDDRVLAGVAGGMAETYDMDPALVRVLWALLIVFTGGVFLIIYVVMALVVPLRAWEPPATADTADAARPSATDPSATETTTTGTPSGAPGGPAHNWQAGNWQAGYAGRRERRSGDNTGPLILGALLIIVGGLFLLRQFIAIDIGQLWPIAVIGLGILLIVSAFGRREKRA